MTRIPQERQLKDITADELRKLLDYDPASGEFRWKPRPWTNKAWNVRCAGKIAGALSGEGYRLISLKDRLYKAHRLAWLYVTGQWPQDQIDHINGAHDDNRFANLREATNSQNNANVGLKKHNTSGFKGVSFSKRSGKWHASIKVDNRLHRLGYFNTPEAAYAAYCEAAARLHREFARVA